MIESEIDEEEEEEEELVDAANFDDVVEGEDDG